LKPEKYAVWQYGALFSHTKSRLLCWTTWAVLFLYDWTFVLWQHILTKVFLWVNGNHVWSHNNWCKATVEHLETLLENSWYMFWNYRFETIFYYYVMIVVVTTFTSKHSFVISNFYFVFLDDGHIKFYIQCSRWKISHFDKSPSS
jgi:hypothetical protein